DVSGASLRQRRADHLVSIDQVDARHCVFEANQCVYEVHGIGDPDCPLEQDQPQAIAFELGATCETTQRTTKVVDPDGHDLRHSFRPKFASLQVAELCLKRRIVIAKV